MVRLGPLDDVDLAGIAASVTGARPDADALRALAEVRGNPFLVSMVAAGATSGDDRLPTQDLLRRMAGSLDPELRTFLELAAIAGRELDVEVIASASGRRVAGVVGLARAGVERGWLAADDDVVRFRHELLAESLVAALPLDQRDQAHLALGRALAALGHAPGRAAFHFDAAAYLLTAADVASLRSVIGGLPHDEAIALSLARRLLELDGRDPASVAVAIRCLAAHRHHAEVLRVARPWLHPAATGPDVFALRLLAATSAASAAGESVALAILQEGLAVDAMPLAVRADYLNAVARLHWYAREAEPVREAATRALEVSRAAGNVRAQIAALCSLSEAAALLGDAAEAVTRADQAVALAQRSSVGSARPELALGTALVSAGRFAEGMPVLSRSLRVAEAEGDPAAMALAQVVMHGSRFHTGDWDGFVADADAMADIGADTGVRSGIVLPLALAAAVAVRRADFAAVPALLARLRVEHTQGDAHPGAVVGLLLADVADDEAAGRLRERRAGPWT